MLSFYYFSQSLINIQLGWSLLVQSIVNWMFIWRGFLGNETIEGTHNSFPAILITWNFEPVNWVLILLFALSKWKPTFLHCIKSNIKSIAGFVLLKLNKIFVKCDHQFETYMYRENSNVLDFITPIYKVIHLPKRIMNGFENFSKFVKRIVFLFRV